jgi:hypothetical protein
MITLLLIIAHFIGDFVLQSSKAAMQKQQKFSSLLKHCLLYASVAVIILLISADVKYFIIPFIVIIISHFVIDLSRASIDKRADSRIQLFSFFIDQILHLGIIALTAYGFGLNSHVGGLLQYTYQTFGEEQIDRGIIYILIYLTMLQPAAVSVKKLLTYISNQKFEDKTENTVTTYNAGYIIGVVERIIIATLVLQNQLSAIGFVLAAKSIARFSQLNDKEFAEKYLVGSLASMAVSIIVPLIFKSML